MIDYLPALICVELTESAVSLIGPLGGLTIATVAAIWATVRLVYYAIQSGESAVLAYTERVWKAYLVAVTAIVSLELWPGLSTWATGTWTLLTGLV